MKTKPFAVFLLLSATTVNAQLTKGTKNMSGYMNFQKQNQADNDTSDRNTYSSDAFLTNINVGAGKFVKDNLLAGVSLGYSTSSSNSKNLYTNAGFRQENAVKNTSNNFNLGVYGRQYKPFYKERFAFFMHAALEGSYGKGSSENNRNDNFSTTKTTSNSESVGVNLSFRPGFAYFVTNRIAIEALAGGSFSAGYSVMTTTVGGKRTGKNENMVYGINFNPFGISFGFNYFFGSIGAAH